MRPLRPEVQGFLNGCEHFLSLDSTHDLSPQESDLIDHYVGEVQKRLYGNAPELGWRGADAA